MTQPKQRTLLITVQKALDENTIEVVDNLNKAVAAIGAAVLRVKLGDYALAFYISAGMCLIASIAVLQIAKGKTTIELRG